MVTTEQAYRDALTSLVRELEVHRGVVDQQRAWFATMASLRGHLVQLGVTPCVFRLTPEGAVFLSGA